MAANPKLGGFLDSLLNFGGQVAPSVIGALQGGGSGGTGSPAKGLAAITSFCQKVTDGLKQILQAAPNIPQDQAIASANQLAALLSDGSQVYQAKRGKDAEVLANAKTEARNIISQINAKYSNAATVIDVTSGGTVVNTGAVVSGGNNAAAVSAGGGEIVAGVPNLVLVGGAAAILVLFLIKK
jgi:hypothetical protein